MDACLLAELGCDGVQAHAVGLTDAVAAAFADVLVDDEAQRRLSYFAAGAVATLLGRALLIVDDDGDAGDLFQLAEDGGELVSVTQVGVAGQGDIVAVFLQVIGEQYCLFHALRFQLAGQIGNGESAGGVLAAFHRDCAVIQDLVGDVDGSGDAGFEG